MWTNRRLDIVHQNTLLRQRGRDSLIIHQKIAGVFTVNPTHFASESADGFMPGTTPNQYTPAPMINAITSKITRIAMYPSSV
jgi:hypothetical protein